MIVDIDALHLVVPRMLEEIATPDVAEFWDSIQITANPVADSRKINLLIWGKRKKDSGSSTLWKWWKKISYEDAANLGYVESQVANLYYTLRDHDTCDCDLAGVKWHPDSDGDMVVPEFIQKYCKNHRPKELDESSE